MARGLAVIAVLALFGVAVLVAVLVTRDNAGQDEPSEKPGGSHQPSLVEPPAPDLVRAPKAVLNACLSLQPQRTLPVLCPRRLPRAKWRVRYRSLEAGSRSRYLTDLRVHADPMAHHVLAGGRRRPFSLEESDGQWPSRVPRAGERCCARPGDLGLVGARERSAGIWKPVRMTVLRRASVRSRPALLLQAAPYPVGGIHGDHVVVIWNQGSRGYVFSIHAKRAGRATQQEQAVALAAAEAMARVP